MIPVAGFLYDNIWSLNYYVFQNIKYSFDCEQGGQFIVMVISLNNY